MATLLDYLFNVTPGVPNAMFWLGTLIVSGLLLASGILGIVLQRSEEKFAHRLGERLGMWGFTGGVLMLLLASFRFQNVYWFGMRSLIYVWAHILIVWGAYIARWWFWSVPSLRAKRQMNQEYNRYLPSKK